MNRAARWFGAILLLACCGLRMGDVPAIAQVAPAATAPSALEYRTIFVPQAQLTKMASGHLPVKRDEFQQLLATINASPSGPGGASVRLTRAEYTARLQGVELVAGTASLQVQHRLPDVATLGLDPCTLAITTPRWGNDSKKPARMGVDGAGRLVVLVEAAAAAAESQMREEELHFDWSLRGARDPAGVLIFDLQTPACPTSRLTLDLPAGVTPVVGQGVVTALKSAAMPPIEAERQTWQIEVGGRTRTTLSIVPNAGMTVNQRYVLLKQSTVYDLTPAALDTSIELDLDIYHEPLRQLTLAASSELRITSIRAGELEIPWSVAISDDPHMQRLVLEFSEPMQGADRILRVTGVSPMVWDQPWRLPTLQAEGVSWQEGTLTLQSPQAIELRDLVPTHCRQTKISNLPAPRSGESHQFQSSLSSASLQIVVGHPEVRLKCVSGTTLKWDGTNVTGRLVADVTALQSQTYKLKADVPAGWTIDSVETVPAEALDDWNFTPQAGQAQSLAVRLSQAISAQRGVRLIVIGHRRALPTRGNQPRAALAAHEYRLAEFQQVTERRRLVSAQADSQQQLGLVGDLGIVRLEPSALVDAERTLFENGAGRLLFLDDSVSANFGLRVRSESPRYAATIQLIATLKPTSLSELCRIRCVPEATPVARVLVQFSPSGAVSPNWQLDQEPAGEFTARLLTDAERRATALTDGETWEITLQRPRSAPFELTAQRTRNIPRGPEPHAVSLVSLPQADSQTGQIEVHASDGAIPSIQSFDLKPLMPEPPAYNAISTQQAVFRYTPAQEQRLLISHRPEEARTATLWAWNAILTSRIGSSGRCVHALRYELENTGRPNVQLQLLESQTLREVRVNGTRVVALAVAQQQTLTIPLPPRERYCTLQVEYEESCPTRAMLAKTQLRWPQLDAPILNHRLRLCVPPELALADASQPASWGWQAQPDWRSRLFGALARPASSRPPSLFSLDDWSREFHQEPVPVALRRRGEACLQAWEQLLAPARDTNRAETLGEWAQRYGRLASDNPEALRPLQIDAAALAHYGWYGDSLLATATASGSLTSGELLRRAGLVFVLTEDSLILTTRDQLTPARPGWELAPQLLFVNDSSSSTSDDDSFDTTLGVKAWLALPQTARSPWPAEPLNTLSDLEASGWRVYHLSLGDEASTAIVLCRQHEILAVAWGLFLVVAACMYWVGRRRLRIWIICTGCAALVALILPGPLVPWGTSIFLGALVAGVTLAARHDRKVYRVIAPGSTMTHALPRVTAPAVVIIALAGCWLTLSYAQESTESKKQTPPAELQRVLIPVDDNQKPVGDYIYLPKAFYDALHRLAQDAKAAPQGWIVYDANYLGRLQWETIGVKLSFAELSIAYDLEVFHPNTRVTLGLGRENVHLLNDHVILEGEAIDIDWLESGEGFTFLVSKPGRYRLELGVKPAVRVAAARAEVDIKIPRLARSHLLLKLPADAPAVHVPRALGALIAGEPGELRVELGPAERLAVQWRTADAAEAPTGEVEASQLLWWKIRPGATILEAVWKFKSTGQPLREVRLVTDPRLRLLPLDAKEPVQEHFIRDGDVKAIQFILKEPYEREVTIHTTFSLVGASGIGNVALPQLDPVADRFTRRWLAITAAPTLLAEVNSAASTTPLTAQEFLTAWGEAEATPQQTYVLTAGGAPFSLAVQPREPNVVARQELSYRIAARRTAVQLTSDVEVDEGQLFQHHIAVPEGFTASEVTVDDGKSIRAARFAWANSRTLVAFMPTALSGTYRVTLRGEYAMPNRGNWQLPLLSMSGANATTNLITIERTSDLSVQLEDFTKDYLPAASLAPDAPSVLARLQPRDSQKLAPIGLKFTPVQVQFKAQQVIAITRNNDAWQASIDCFGDVVSGQLDTLRWEIPGDWTGPFRVSVPATSEVVTIPGQARRQLVVRFQSVLAKQFHVRITAPLASMPGERLQLPELNLLDPIETETIVVLPALSDRQQIAWETRGLQAVELPAERRHLASQNAPAYLVVGARYQAIVKRVERVAGVPQVRLADVRLSRQQDGGCYGVASFDLEPAGLTQCQLELPEGYTLLHCRVAELPALLSRVAANRWQLMLHHDQLPQHIEVVFRVPPGSGNELQAPTLVSLPVERTLWTVATTNSPERYELVDSERQVDASRQTLYRLKNAAALLEQAAGVLPESDTSEVTSWYLPWARRGVSAKAAFAQQEADRESPSVALTHEMRSLAQDADVITQQWGVSPLAAQAERESTQPAGDADLMPLLSPTSAPALRAMLPGSATALTIHARRTQASPLIGRWIVSLVIVAILLATSLLRRWPLVADAAIRYPQALGMVVGLGWWVLLQPGLIGLAIVLLFAISTLRWPWPVTGELASTGLFANTLRYRNRR